MLPLVGDINAGFPRGAEGYEDRSLNLHEWLVQNPAATFFYRVQVNELHDEHVRDGSVLVVDRSLSPRRDALVIIEDEGNFIVCRFRHQSVVIGVVFAAVMRF
jgi:DNA polymerase V